MSIGSTMSTDWRDISKHPNQIVSTSETAKLQGDQDSTFQTVRRHHMMEGTLKRSIFGPVLSHTGITHQKMSRGFETSPLAFCKGSQHFEDQKQVNNARIPARVKRSKGFEGDSC